MSREASPGANGRENRSFSPRFRRFLRSVAGAKTAQQERDLLASEVNSLRIDLGANDLTSVASMTLRSHAHGAKRLEADGQLLKAKTAELLALCLYGETMGYSTAEFAHIKAVTLVQDAQTLFEKHIGYLCVSMFLHEDHELNLLMVNTIQRDLASDNQDIIAMALKVVSAIASTDMVPSLLPMVTGCLRHEDLLVRKSAVTALRRLFRVAPHLITFEMKRLKRTLADADPSVMAATLSVYLHAAQIDPAKCLPLLDAFIHIQRQAIAGRLSSTHDFHGVPAPWVLIRTLEIITLLDNDDQATNQKIYTIILETLERASKGGEASYAVTYACIRGLDHLVTKPTVRSLVPPLTRDPPSLPWRSISQLLGSKNHNLRYVGLWGLEMWAKLDPEAVGLHRAVVEEGLESEDETIQRKALDILMGTVSEATYEAVLSQVLKIVKTSDDTAFKERLTAKAMDVLDSIPTLDQQQYITHAVQLLPLLPDGSRRGIISSLTKTISRNPLSAATIPALDAFCRNSLLELDVREINLLSFVTWVGLRSASLVPVRLE
ncbi:adaptin N terminal region-domain-containing protein [Fimicolochytrium jonesii]|uniref:adaptin N terminal region-domain-containing protein n=1 Tax=Fimicolochytrium jonesii TaxID=1396493 RepID=UPI0022FE997C|nr:adaptin N terminal region-domain-containing protein [Fimicolochytrium jonesii]KAI8818691.1 adaptin N terminal region-domain-containing protein [Fimicolochytrium jonesii]